MDRNGQHCAVSGDGAVAEGAGECRGGQEHTVQHSQDAEVVAGGVMYAIYGTNYPRLVDKETR